MSDSNVNSKGAVPRHLRRNSTKRPVSSQPYLEVPMGEDFDRYMEKMGQLPRRSLNDDVLKDTSKTSLMVPDSPTIRRHSFNEKDVILARMAPNRRSSRVRRSTSVISSRSRRGSKYYTGVERRASNTSGYNNGDFSLIVEKKCTSPEAYNKELRRRRIVWLVIGMFFFILMVSVLVVVITLTHRIDHSDRRRFNQSCL
ncbi:hypothetical protein WA026_004158 [Henosepilachna vigintioctopunctata]|uniref:Uncharacterized protein n=1 Tax=Henosepilachna vigintioctopunctata TaxID=420089 RepID=A0AAW1UGP6_9CUCU